jgi:hypothetical protein
VQSSQSPPRQDGDEQGESSRSDELTAFSPYLNIINLGEVS